MVVRTSLVVAALVLFSLAGVCATDISGKWTSEFESGVGPQKYTFEFKVEDGKITGTAKADIGGTVMDSKITDGKIEGDKISFSESLDYQGMPLTIEYKGTVSKDEITVEHDVGGQSAGTIVLKRAKKE